MRNRKTEKLESLHVILKKTAYMQALFMWVDGYLVANPDARASAAISAFSERFDVSINTQSAVTQYHRMKNAHLKQKQVLK